MWYYIHQFWKGQFGQAAAFWGVLLLSVLFIQAGATLLAVFNVIQDQVFSARLWLAVAAFVVCVYLPWAFIGSFRSIVLHIHKLKQASAGIWLMGCWVLVLVLSLFSLYQHVPIFKNMAAIAFYSDEEPLVAERVNDGLVLSGFLGYGSTREVKALLQQQPQGATITLNISGGHLHEARKLAAYILKGRFDTHVSTLCIGNCFIVLAAGYKRTANESAVFEFYEYLNYANGYRSDWLIYREQQKDRSYFERRGVLPRFSYELFYKHSNNKVFSPDSGYLYRNSLLTAPPISP